MATARSTVASIVGYTLVATPSVTQPGEFCRSCLPAGIGPTCLILPYGSPASTTAGATGVESTRASRPRARAWSAPRVTGPPRAEASPARTAVTIHVPTPGRATATTNAASDETAAAIRAISRRDPTAPPFSACFRSPVLGGFGAWAGCVSEDAGRAGERVCDGCGVRLKPEARPNAVYCSGACRSRQWRRERRLRKRVAAELSGVGRAECPECGATWVAGVDRRSNAVYCSRRCVTRAWRARKETFGERSQ